MDLSEFMSLLKKYRRHLTFQQFNTLKGQAIAGDIDVAFKGLPLTAGEPSPLLWNLAVRSTAEIMQALLSMMTEEFYSYKK